jgi:hypothetical protein
MKELHRQIIIAFIAGVVFLLTTFVTEAKSIGDFTIYPTYKHNDNSVWIIRENKPGDRVEDSVTVENLTSEQITIDLFIKEGEEKESFIIHEDREFRNIGDWIELKTTNIELKPFEKIKVPVNILIPSETETGEYIGVILAAKSKVNDEGINVVTRIGVRVYLTVTDNPSINNYQTNIFAVSPFSSALFMILSVVGFSGSIILNLITVKESRNR